MPPRRSPKNHKPAAASAAPKPTVIGAVPLEISARGRAAPVQYVNAARVIPSPDGLLVYFLARGPDADMLAGAGVDPVAKILLRPDFAEPFVKLVIEQGGRMGLFVEATEAPTPAERA